MKLVEIQIAPLGKWNGYIGGDGKPRTFEVTNELVKSAVEHFNAGRGANGQKLPIDYEHQTLSGGVAPAAGWIHKLIDEGKEGLYALVEWTQRAAEYIRNGEYKYISPVLDFDRPDPVTGEPVAMSLFNAAITNVPFIPTIKEVLLRTHTGAGFVINSIDITHSIIGVNMDLNDILAKIVAAAGLPSTASWDDVMGFVKKAADFAKTIPQGMTPEQMVTEAPDALAMRADVVKLLKCDAKRDSIIAAVTALQSAATDENTKLRERITKLETEQRNTEADKFLVLNVKRIPPAARDAYRDMYIANPESAKAIVAKLPEMHLDASIDTHAIAAEPVVTDDVKRIAASMGITPDKVIEYVKTDRA